MGWGSETTMASEYAISLCRAAPDFYNAVKHVVRLIPDLRETSRVGFSDSEAPWDPWVDVHREYIGLVACSAADSPSRPEWKRVIEVIQGKIELDMPMERFEWTPVDAELAKHIRDFVTFFPLLTFLYARTSKTGLVKVLAAVEAVSPFEISLRVPEGANLVLKVSHAEIINIRNFAIFQALRVDTIVSLPVSKLKAYIACIDTRTPIDLDTVRICGVLFQSLEYHEEENDTLADSLGFSIPEILYTLLCMVFRTARALKLPKGIKYSRGLQGISVPAIQCRILLRTTTTSDANAILKRSERTRLKFLDTALLAHDFDLFDRLLATIVRRAGMGTDDLLQRDRYHIVGALLRNMDKKVRKHLRKLQFAWKAQDIINYYRERGIQSVAGLVHVIGEIDAAGRVAIVKHIREDSSYARLSELPACIELFLLCQVSILGDESSSVWGGLLLEHGAAAS